MMKRVVVGIEELPHSDAALGWAAMAAEQRGATLQLVHATGFPMAGLDVLADDWVLQGAEALMARAVAQAEDLTPTVEVDSVIDRRRPAEALIDLAQGLLDLRGLDPAERLEYHCVEDRGRDRDEQGERPRRPHRRPAGAGPAQP